jgi:hypothetical protein
MAAQLATGRWNVLACLTLVAVMNQWARHLFVYMGTVPYAALEPSRAGFVNLRVDLALDRCATHNPGYSLVPAQRCCSKGEQSVPL